MAVNRPTPPTTQIVPLFALPDVILFPGLVLPLHIFEPRYRQMVGDVLDGSGEIVLGTVLGATSTELAGSPPIENIAGLGRIEHYRKLEEGRFDILLNGTARVRAEEVESERLYRQVSVEIIEEDPCSSRETEELKPQLLRALNELSDTALDLPAEMSVGLLSDLLLARLSLPPAKQHALYANTNISDRARAVLAHHEG